MSTYPVLCLVDLFTTSSTLSNSALICSLREMLNEEGMLEKKEQESSSKNFNTSKQVTFVIEQFFLALIYLAKGDNIDLKSIANSINKKNPNSPNIDADVLENLEAISQHSLDDLEQVIFKLGCQQSRELILEFYGIMI